VTARRYRGSLAGTAFGAAAVLAAAGLLSFSACTRQSAPSAVESLTAKAAVDSLWSGYAHASDEKDPEGFAKLFTDDAVVDYSGAPTARGRDAIVTFLTSLYIDIDPTGLRIEPDETRVSGSTAVQSGAFQEHFIEKNMAKTEHGRFVLVAERGDKDIWKIRRLVAIVDSTTAD
jgi:uncharacterized protein (TIGR02246 family)